MIYYFIKRAFCNINLPLIKSSIPHTDINQARKRNFAPDNLALEHGIFKMFKHQKQRRVAK